MFARFRLQQGLLWSRFAKKIDQVFDLDILTLHLFVQRLDLFPQRGQIHQMYFFSVKNGLIGLSISWIVLSNLQLINKFESSTDYFMSMIYYQNYFSSFFFINVPFIFYKSRPKMKKSTAKSYSNLDLKLLDVKFIAIDDGQTYLTQAYQSVRKTKISELPSLLKPKTKEYPDIFGDTNAGDSSNLFSSDKKNNKTIMQSCSQFDQSILSYKFRNSQSSCMEETVPKKSPLKSNFGKIFAEESAFDQIQRLKEQIMQKKLEQRKLKKGANKSMPLIKAMNCMKNQQQEQLEKYRRKISFVKRQNSMIHKQISSLYRNKIDQNKQPLKKIRKIEPYRFQSSTTDVYLKAYEPKRKQNHELNMKSTFDIQKLMKKSFLNRNQNSYIIDKSMSPLAKEKLNFYENLVDKSPFKEELQQVHKKIISNNLHKNFEQYLLNANKRVPEFIKKLRS